MPRPSLAEDRPIRATHRRHHGITEKNSFSRIVRIGGQSLKELLPDPNEEGHPVKDASLPSTVCSWMGLREGERIPSGPLILEVLHVSEKCGVFIVEGENLKWAIDTTAVKDPSVVSEASALIVQVKTAVGEKVAQRRAVKIVGSALAQPLEARDEQVPAEFFAEARAFVAATQREALQSYYLCAAFVAVAILAPVLTISASWISPGLQLYAIASALGTVGAMVSVAVRFRSLKIDRYTSHRFTMIGGASRIVFGGLFAATLLLFQKADVVLAFAKDQVELSAVASLLAGFSERLIPELLEKFETKVQGSVK